MENVTSQFRLAIERIDAANSHDPHVIADVPAEVLYSQRMTAWLEKLYPQASDALQIAARAQHIRRWEVPRDSYPMDRAGYHRWRTGLYTFHADITANILREVGYEESVIDRVKSLLKKERLKADPETQALEDVICVVFLENYFADFVAKHDEQKLIVILRRTWAKMSQVGRDAALKLPMSANAATLIGKALAKNG
jgi:Domain of unknown function (DUF4202)